MQILFQGQLGVAAGTSQLQIELNQGATINEVICEISQNLSDEARDLIMNSDGTVRNSLFIALDDNHVLDSNTLIPESTKELVLIPPMAGG